jgi:exodeoxyribonuclease VII small subunit
MTDNEMDISYSDAIDELEQLLDDIEGDEVDLDGLTDKVERASELIGHCRDKIESTEMQIDTIIDDLESDLEEES